MQSRISFWICAMLCSSAGGATEVEFEGDVLPILSEHCFACHAAEEHEAGLRLDLRSSMLRGGDSGSAAVIPGDPANSLLVRRVLHAEAEHRMPPDSEPLSKLQADKLERWIAEGAVWPGQMTAMDDSLTTEHWSFQPRQAVEPPGDFAEPNPIDAFIAQKLHASGLAFSPPADAISLVRRVSFDLLSLPPSKEQVAQFVREEDLEALLDELLASPHYGQRWGQHWLDVIRWAETVGFETNLERPNAWPYRDWVIESLNQDMPYDQFVFEQLAGDTLASDAALGFLVAGPANLPGQIGRDQEAMRQARQDELDEVINTVSQSLLGLTVGCARCHNHKFDPILARDYYGLQAIFAGLNYGDRRLRGELDDAWTRQLPEARQRLKALRSELDAFQKEFGLREPLEDLQTEAFEPGRALAVRMEIHATAGGRAASLYEFQAWTAVDGIPSQNVALASAGSVPSASSFALSNQTRHFDNLVDGTADRRQAFPWEAAQSGPAWLQIDFPKAERIDRIVWDQGSEVPVDYEIKVLLESPEQEPSWKTVAHTRDRLPRTDDKRAAADIRLKDLASAQIQRLVKLLDAYRAASAEVQRLAAGPQVYAANFVDSPEPTWLLHRGDAMQRTQRLAPAIPEVLGDLQLAIDEPEVSRRLALARHLTDPHHPLVPRVIVNRVWQYHFGTGLVSTPSDFGKMGAAPSHPELLDWLATWFVGEGWSLKKLHRLIISSRTYRQSSQPNSAALQVDANCRLLWRFPPRRLEAEAIRDSMLAVAGRLDLSMGGPGFDFFNQRGGLSNYIPKETFDGDGLRRMVYSHKIRMQSVDIFGAFDCPDAGQMRPRRTQSITPLQALGLLNSPFAIRQAEAFAQCVEAEVGTGDVAAQVRRAFQIAYSRSPDAAEAEPLIELVRAHGLIQLCRAMFNTSEFVVLR